MISASLCVRVGSRLLTNNTTRQWPILASDGLRPSKRWLDGSAGPTLAIRSVWIELHSFITMRTPPSIPIPCHFQRQQMPNANAKCQCQCQCPMPMSNANVQCPMSKFEFELAPHAYLRFDVHYLLRLFAQDRVDDEKARQFRWTHGVARVFHAWRAAAAASSALFEALQYRRLATLLRFLQV